MFFFLEDIFLKIASPEISLLYHLFLASSLIQTLPAAISQLRNTDYPQTRRMTMGLFVILFGQISLFIISVLVLQGIMPPNMLPPIDRGIILFSVLIIAWMWIFPEPVQMVDIGFIVSLIVIIAAAIIGANVNTSSPDQLGFNNTLQNKIWGGVSAFVAIAGVVLLILRRPIGWVNGLAMLTMMFLGFTLDIFVYALLAGNYPVFTRLMLMSSYPLLLTLPTRFPTPGDGTGQPQTISFFQKNVAEPATTDRPSQALRERRRYSTDPKTLTSLLSLAAEVDANKINQHISRSVAQAMLSDLCFVIYIGADKTSLFFASGYDLIREENLEGGPLNKETVPMLANAIPRGRALRLPASTTSSDLKGLGDMLGLTTPGNLLNVPIMDEKGPIGSILLLSPYSNRLWNADDQTFLSSIASSFIPIVERGRRIAEIEHERDRAKINAEDAYAQLSRIQVANNNLNQEVSSLKALVERGNQSESQRQALSEEFEKIRQEHDRLKAQLEKIRADGGVMATEDSSYLENELRLTLREVARLQNTLAEANIKIIELEKRPSNNSRMGSNQVEVITSIAQELRQPLSSIIGYTDLILGESVGILAALQRKFVERIKTSAERVGSLIDDLIQLTSLETDLMSMKPESVDLNLVIDNAVAYTSSQLREKNITLRIDVPDTIQPIQADREAIQQILVHLLQNAGSATPIESAITLRVRTEIQGEQEYVLLQVIDSGGGIPADDIAKVFGKFYRAESVLIQGLGETGVGLSIAKALTEAQGGRIWVESETGTGSSFSVLLPISQEQLVS